MIHETETTKMDFTMGKDLAVPVLAAAARDRSRMTGYRKSGKIPFMNDKQGEMDGGRGV